MIKKALGFKKHSTKALSTQLNSPFSLYNVPLTLYSWEAKDFVEKGYTKNANVYKIVQKIIQKLGVAQLELYIDNGDDKARKYRKYRSNKYNATPTEHVKKRLYTKALEYAPEESDLFQLLENPNPVQTWRDLSELFWLFYTVQGETFYIRETALNSYKALELYTVPPSRMNHIVKNDELVGWQYNMPDGRVRTWIGDDMKNVFHMKMASPLFDIGGSQFRGFSPLLAGLKYLQLDDYAIEAWLKSLQNEGAKGIISPNHPDKENWLNPEQREKTQEMVEAKIQGMNNKNKIVVSGMPLQYTQIGLSPDALNIINSLEKAGDNLCDLWGVPAILFEKNPTYQNQREGAARFIRDVILPYLNKQEDALNKWLVEPFRVEGKNKINYVLDYDTSLYDELQMSLEERKSLDGKLTLNELRAIDGFDAIDNEYADEVFIDTNKIPLSDYSGGNDFVN